MPGATFVASLQRCRDALYSYLVTHVFTFWDWRPVDAVGFHQAKHRSASTPKPPRRRSATYDPVDVRGVRLDAYGNYLVLLLFGLSVSSSAMSRIYLASDIK